MTSWPTPSPAITAIFSCLMGFGFRIRNPKLSQLQQADGSLGSGKLHVRAAGSDHTFQMRLRVGTLLAHIEVARNFAIRRGYRTHVCAGGRGHPQSDAAVAGGCLYVALRH